MSRREKDSDVAEGKVGAEIGISQGDFTKLSAAREAEGYYDDEDATKKVVNDNTEISSEDVASLKFGEDIKILLIGTVDYRVICHFMGCNAVKDVQNAVYKHVSMIGQLAQQCLIDFMRTVGFAYAGEIFFDQGQPVPCGKQTWTLKSREISFTNMGYLFFEHKSGKKRDNVVAFNWVDPNSGMAGITLYSVQIKKSKKLLEGLEAYTKEKNCARGAKLRDVNMSSATFSEVKSTKKHNWENFYFPQHIRDMYSLEVFGFLNSTDRYNKLGIYKRGVLMFGPPGTGKTTIGHIICNESPDATIIWITPDLISENNNGKHAVKLLYLLADFVSPAVIFLEDLDLFAEDRDSTQGDIPLGALMNILDGVNQVHNAVTIATTNRLELIEKALSNRPGRFDRVVEIPVMPKPLRKKMFTDRVVGCKVDDGVIDEIVKISNGWTGAECQEFVNSMNLHFISQKQDDKRHITLDVVTTVHKMIFDLSRQVHQSKTAGYGAEGK